MAECELALHLSSESPLYNGEQFLVQRQHFAISKLPARNTWAIRGLLAANKFRGHPSKIHAELGESTPEGERTLILVEDASSLVWELTDAPYPVDDPPLLERATGPLHFYHMRLAEGTRSYLSCKDGFAALSDEPVAWEIIDTYPMSLTYVLINRYDGKVLKEKISMLLRGDEARSLGGP